MVLMAFLGIIFVWMVLAFVKPGTFAPFFKEDTKLRRIKILGIGAALFFGSIIFDVLINPPPKIDPATLVGKDCVVTVAQAKVYEKADLKSKVLKTLPKGAMRKILEGKTVDKLDWFRISDNAWVNGKEVSARDFDVSAARSALDKKGKGSINKEFTVAGDKAINVYDQPSTSGNVVDHLESWQILTVKDFKQIGDYFWYMYDDNKWVSDQDVTFKSDVIDKKKKTTDEKGKSAIGKKFVTAGDSSVMAYDQPSSSGKVVAQVAKWQSFTISDFKQVGADDFWYMYNDGKWVSGKDITFDNDAVEKRKKDLQEKQAAQAAEIKKQQEETKARQAEQAKKQREYDAAHPITQRSWTKYDNFFNHVKVEVTNKSYTKKTVLVSVRIYTGDAVRSEMSDSMTIDARGKWIADFPVDPNIKGDYQYKVDLSY
jgi:hypothetical protein